MSTPPEIPPPHHPQHISLADLDIVPAKSSSPPGDHRHRVSSASTLLHENSRRGSIMGRKTSDEEDQRDEVEPPTVVADGTHTEKHTAHGPVVRDVIIGGADGLTVPFALTAGLSSLGSARLVIIGGLAELFSGAISMGLGAYLAAVTERDHYISEEKREREEVRTIPDKEKKECYGILEKYGLSHTTVVPVVEEMAANEDDWVAFMMDFELKLEKPALSRAWISGATMGISYFIGGLIPMLPYFAMHNVTHALFVSIAITVLTLLVFGYTKNYVTIKTKRAGVYGAFQTLFIGVLAAGTSYGIVRAIDSRSD